MDGEIQMERGKREVLKALADAAEMAQKRSLRFPFKEWARLLGCCENTVRNEIHRGLCRMGSEEKGFYYVYDAAIAEEKAKTAARRQGNKSLLVRRRRNKDFAAALIYLCGLLLRKKTHKRDAGGAMRRRFWYNRGMDAKEVLTEHLCYGLVFFAYIAVFGFDIAGKRHCFGAWFARLLERMPCGGAVEWLAVPSAVLLYVVYFAAVLNFATFCTETFGTAIGVSIALPWVVFALFPCGAFLAGEILANRARLAFHAALHSIPLVYLAWRVRDCRSFFSLRSRRFFFSPNA